MLTGCFARLASISLGDKSSTVRQFWAIDKDIVTKIAAQSQCDIMLRFFGVN